jgi:hypothetical protein
MRVAYFVIGQGKNSYNDRGAQNISVQGGRTPNDSNLEAPIDYSLIFKRSRWSFAQVM